MQRKLCLLLILFVLSVPALAQVITFNKYVTTSADDAEENTTGASVGAMNLTSTDVELTTDGTINQHIGLRFTNIIIPQGVTIQNAFIQFTTKGDKNAVLGAISIKGFAADNPGTFTTTAFNLSSRAVTTESVTWPGSTSTTWGTTAGGTRGPDQKTPDLKTIIQAIVNRPGWASGNAMGLIFTGSGVRNAYSYDGSTTLAAELIVQYTSPGFPANNFPINRINSGWQYFDQGTLPAANWMDSSYSDATWNYGPAILGYNRSQATTVSFGPDANNKHITTYFRCNLNMTNTANYDSLILRLLRDDGAVVYINGNEVYRTNMPAGAVTNSTPAFSDVDGQDENAYFSTVIKNDLVNGRNVIAVEIHQSGPTTDDAGFDLQLSAKMATMPVINFPIPKNSQWNYLDDGTNQSASFTSPSLYDAAWNYGPGKLGYSDAPATTLQFGPFSANKYITYYFRKKFNVVGLAGLANFLTLNVLRDDGAIVYINGTEVVRTNMPVDPITYLTFSSTIVDGTDESTYFTYQVPKSVLVEGTNTITAEVHQRDGTSSDIGFDLELKETGAATLLRGPYLQSGTSTSMVIRWRTDAATNSRVKFGLSAAALNTIVDSAQAVTEHEVKLTGLNPLTKYYYSIGSSTLLLQGNTDNYFSTLPVPGDTGLVRIGVIGDCGNNSTNQLQVRDQLRNYLGSNYMNSWILLGDNAYSNGTDAEYQAEFFNIYKDYFLKQNPLYPSPGNHDYDNGSATAQNTHNVPYYSTFSMPVNGEAGGVPSNNKAYYSFDVGNVHFLSLDSYGKEDNATRLYDTLGRQVQWIKDDLAANTNKGWVVAYWHHPPYTKGSHNSDTEGELVNIRTNFIRILERLGVDVILCGHSHVYERSKLQKGHYGVETTFDPLIHNVSTSSALYDGSSNSCPYVKDSVNLLTGTVYVVSGSAGQLGGTVAGYPHNAMYYSNPTNGGSMILEVQGNRLNAKWICADGVIRDNFTMMKNTNLKKDTAITTGSSITLTASYNGNYNWLPGNQTTRSITVTPPAGTTTYYVKDNLNCIADTFNVTASGVLAVTWGNLEGNFDKVIVANKLTWKTFNESNNNHFEIERSLDGLSYVTLGTMAGAGNSNTSKTYTYTDQNINLAVVVYYYRIKQVDNNGLYTYSPVVSIRPLQNGHEIDIEVKPNPGSGSEMKIRLLNANSMMSRLTVYDVAGKLVYSKEILLSNILQPFFIDIQPGSYFLKIFGEKGTVTKQIIVQ